jgi:hypothetical protein
MFCSKHSLSNALQKSILNFKSYHAFFNDLVTMTRIINSLLTKKLIVMKKQLVIGFRLLFLGCVLLIFGCKNDIQELNKVSLSEIENRSSEDNTPVTPSMYSTDPTDRTNIQVDGVNFIISPAILSDFEVANDSFFIKNYSVSEATWTEYGYDKVYHIISSRELSKEYEIDLIKAVLDDNEEVDPSFSGAIAVLDDMLKPEKVKVYGEAFTNTTGESVAYRIEHVATGLDAPSVIEERNAPGCFAVYLVEYGVETGYVYQSWFLGFFCVGTGSGGNTNGPASSEPSGGGNGTVNDENNAEEQGDQNCDFSVEIGRFAGQTRLINLMATLGLWGGAGSLPSSPVPITQLNNWCTLQGHIYYQGGCTWGTNITTSSGGGCNCLLLHNVYANTYYEGARTIESTFSGNLSSNPSCNETLTLGWSSGFNVSFDMQIWSFPKKLDR